MIGIKVTLVLNQMLQSVTQLVDRYALDTRYREQLDETIRCLQDKRIDVDMRPSVTPATINVCVLEDDNECPLLTEVSEGLFRTFFQRIKEQSCQYSHMPANWSDGHDRQKVTDMDIYKVSFTVPDAPPFVVDIKLGESDILELIVSCEGIFQMVIQEHDTAQPIGYYQNATDSYIMYHKDAAPALLKKAEMGDVPLKMFILQVSVALVTYLCGNIKQMYVQTNQSRQTNPDKPIEDIVDWLAKSYDDIECTDTL